MPTVLILFLHLANRCKDDKGEHYPLLDFKPMSKVEKFLWMLFNVLIAVGLLLAFGGLILLLVGAGLEIYQHLS